jgi:hypothetical protein
VLAHVELAKTVHMSIDVSSSNLFNRAITEQRLMVVDFAAQINQPHLPELIQRFLYDQLYPESNLPSTDVSLNACPTFLGRISVFSSAVATYYAPSDPSGVGSMRSEHIRSTPSWRHGCARHDCAFVNSHPDLEGMRGLDVVRVLSFFSFTYRDVTYPCALVYWFSLLDEEHDEDTGMWMVQLEVAPDGAPVISVIHLDCILHAAHLLPIYGDAPVPLAMTPHDALDAFTAYYVNKFADHHAFEVAS